MSSVIRQLATKVVGYDPFPTLWPQNPSIHSELSRTLISARDGLLKLECDERTQFLWFCSEHLEKSHAQIFQDLFVLYVLGKKRGGFFCDFGATNGVHLSNSYTLEKHFGWTGICAEPARYWHEELRRNRPNTSIETDCVWTTTGETLVFNEVRSKELSTIAAFSTRDGHARRRTPRRSNNYEVSTISLNDMLNKYDAPSDIDYLSIDTEGSELPILEKLDFSRHRPKLITVEHNFTSDREVIFRLLSGKGYRRVLQEFSNFDDWYVCEAVNSDIFCD